MVMLNHTIVAVVTMNMLLGLTAALPTLNSDVGDLNQTFFRRGGGEGSRSWRSKLPRFLGGKGSSKKSRVTIGQGSTVTIQGQVDVNGQILYPARQDGRPAFHVVNNGHTSSASDFTHPGLHYTDHTSSASASPSGLSGSTRSSSPVQSERASSKVQVTSEGSVESSPRSSSASSSKVSTLDRDFARQIQEDVRKQTREGLSSLPGRRGKAPAASPSSLSSSASPRSATSFGIALRKQINEQVQQQLQSSFSEVSGRKGKGIAFEQSIGSKSKSEKSASYEEPPSSSRHRRATWLQKLKPGTTTTLLDDAGRPIKGMKPVLVSKTDRGEAVIHGSINVKKGMGDINIGNIRL